MTYSHDVGALLGSADESPPEVISELEIFTLLMELLGDIRRVKNGLKVHPVHLQLGKLLQDIRYPLQAIEPLHNPPLKGFLEGGKQHSLCASNMIVHQCDSIVETLDDPPSLEGRELKVDIFPSLRHFVQIMLNVELFHCLFSYLDAAFYMLHQAHTQSSRKCEIFIGLDFQSDAF